MSSGSTVAAVASPPGKGARAVLRVSGPETSRLLAAVWAGDDPVPAARGMYPGRFDDGRGTQPLLLLLMPGPRSYTREDVAEFHLPGSPPLVAAALERLIELGAQPAPPGEFTRRAFLNGRLDL
ncbi:MAG: tRNA uridine-5-carboxymethylaminomethyl(34) synthesis GTPase MnmE, partial [Planctomycetes bacterium]|nr:tRNA uridine-5-carboxymethylaminomethyl(34) synthesis GTPase MnmE [Planctomycetota bacterium]